MEPRSSSSRPYPIHGSSFWKIALRDWITLFTFLLLSTAILIQTIAIGGIFWSRIWFGSHFDPEVYSDFAREKSSASVVSAFGLEKALVARRIIDTQIPDEVTWSIDKAGQEMDRTRAREKESSLVRKESEKQADLWIQQSEAAAKNNLSDLAYQYLQNALRSAPDYMPAVKKMARAYEQQHDFAQARFQWEKAAGIAAPQSLEMEDIQQNLERINKLYVESKTKQEPTSILTMPNRTVTPNTVFLKQVIRNDLPPENLYDLYFHLQIILGSRGSEPAMDTHQTRVEIDFFDQSTSAGGTTIPIKVKSAILQPRQPWNTGSDQVLTLKYTLPHKYLNGKIRNFGNSYSFCGFIVRVYYDGSLQDTYAQPADILAKYIKGDDATVIH